MSVNINDLLNKSVQIQESQEEQEQGVDLSAFAINLEGTSLEAEIDMGSIRAAVGAGMAINTVLEARQVSREEQFVSDESE